MNIIERLEGLAESLRAEAAERRSHAERLDYDAANERQKADALELEAAEAVIAANLIHHAGMVVTRNDTGGVDVNMDKVLA